MPLWLVSGVDPGMISYWSDCYGRQSTGQFLLPFFQCLVGTDDLSGDD